MEVRDDVPADDALHLLPLIHVPLPAQGCGYVFRDQGIWQARFRIRIQSGQWIRIRNRIRIQEVTHKFIKKIKKFHVLKCWMFSFES